MGFVDAAAAGGARHAGAEAELPGILKEMYPAWRIWPARGQWHARRRGDFHQDIEPGAPQYALRGPTPAALWVELILETGKEPGSPVVFDAGDGDYGVKVPSRPSRRVHKQCRIRRGGTESSGQGRLRLV